MGYNDVTLDYTYNIQTDTSIGDKLLKSVTESVLELSFYNFEIIFL